MFVTVPGWKKKEALDRTTAHSSSSFASFMEFA
jgi:hypothetical protein